jgi:hypothetical protein
MKNAGKFWLIVAVLVLITCIVGTAHCATRGPARNQTQSNAIGFEPYFTNPYNYEFASVSGGAVLKNDKGDLFTAVQFQPAHTFALYTEQVLFCGNVSDQFHRGPLVVTYERQGHKMLDGVACHNLESVNEVKEENLQQ